ncbi:MAG: lipoprotein [Candidatus Thiodiazotropha sp.]
MQPNLLQSSIILLALLFLVSACGQKGPLYTPDRKQQEVQADKQDS